MLHSRRIGLQEAVKQGLTSLPTQWRQAAKGLVVGLLAGHCDEAYWSSIMETIQSDPIIAELRAVRDTHAARFNYDVGAIFQDIRATQEMSGREYVRYPARRVDATHDETPEALAP